jgi:hypothetical protein
MDYILIWQVTDCQDISDTTARFRKQPQTVAAVLFRAKSHLPGKLVFS